MTELISQLKSSKLEWLELINATYNPTTLLIQYKGYEIYLPLTDSRTLKEFRMAFYMAYQKKSGIWKKEDEKPLIKK